jgi:hypothetical protein
MRALPGDSLSLGAIAPPIRVEMMVADKPVLYFHAAQAMQLRSVSVDPSGGSIVEAWPFVEHAPGSLVWRDVDLDPSGACQPSPLPTATDPACASTPDQCEIPGLAIVRAPGSACVHVGGTTDSMLFYRSVSRSFTPPLRYERRSSGEVVVTNEGDEPVPGLLVRALRYGPSVRTLAVSPPAPHQSIVVGQNFNAADETPRDGELAANAEPGRRAVRTTMHAIGMSEPEIDAFLRAWDGALFGQGSSTMDDGRGVDMPAAPEETMLYFLPEHTCDGISRLHLDPAPSATRRAFAVWSRLSASGASH